MDEVFEIPVLCNNEELNFPAKLLSYGYSYKIEVDINGTWYPLEGRKDLMAKDIAKNLEKILKNKEQGHLN